MDTPVIDFHAHVGNARRGAHVADPDVYIRIMDAAGVDKACINCIWFSDARVGNDLVATFVDKHPDRFVPVAFVTPYYPAEAIRELERAFDQLGSKFLKIYPDYFGKPNDDPAYFPIYEWLNDRGLAVMSHPTYPFDPPGTTMLGRYSALSERFPNVKWVFAHAGGAGSRRLHGAIEAARALPNVHLETATSESNDGAFEYLVGEVGSDRVLYGSDIPVFDPRHQVGKIATSNITNQDKRNILGLNAMRLLGLEF